MVVGMRHEKALLQAGVAQPGDMILSLSPFERNQVADWDRIRLTWLDGQPYSGDLVIRRDYGADRLVYDPKTIYSVTQVEPRDGAITTYREGVHFTRDGRKITWIDGQPQPNRGEVYAVSYAVTTYDWIAFVEPMARFERGTSLGTKVLLRKRHATKPRYADTPF